MGCLKTGGRRVPCLTNPGLQPPSLMYFFLFYLAIFASLGGALASFPFCCFVDGIPFLLILSVPRTSNSALPNIRCRFDFLSFPMSLFKFRFEVPPPSSASRRELSAPPFFLTVLFSCFLLFSCNFLFGEAPFYFFS